MDSAYSLSPLAYWSGVDLGNRHELVAAKATELGPQFHTLSTHRALLFIVRDRRRSSRIWGRMNLHVRILLSQCLFDFVGLSPEQCALFRLEVRYQFLDFANAGVEGLDLLPLFMQIGHCWALPKPDHEAEKGSEEGCYGKPVIVGLTDQGHAHKRTAPNHIRSHHMEGWCRLSSKLL